jgi:hypothetical protein
MRTLWLLVGSAVIGAYALGALLWVVSMLAFVNASQEAFRWV